MKNKYMRFFILLSFIILFNSTFLIAQGPKSSLELEPFKGKKKEMQPGERTEPEEFSVKNTRTDIERKEQRNFPQYSIGLKGGLVYSKISIQNEPPEGNKAGIHTSFMLANEFFFSKSLSLEIDLGYHKSKFKPGNNWVIISYITVPMIVKYYLFDPKSFNVWLGTGFEPRYRVDYSGAQDSEVEKLTESLILTAGVKFPIGDNLRFMVDSRFLLGISRAGGSTQGGDAKYREFMILAGISYDIF
ncbi:MAG: PorT family protein [Spirochaetota bacterium]|nr:PorT family protein [Spirochaetota bacterium]